MLAKTMQHSNFANIFDGFDWDFICYYYIILHFCWHIADPGFILPTKKVLTAFGKEKMLVKCWQLFAAIVILTTSLKKGCLYNA